MVRLILASVLLLGVSLSAIPAAQCQYRYDNGPIDGRTNAQAFNFGFVVSNTFTLTGSDLVVEGFDGVGVWLESDDQLESLQWSITSGPNEGTVYGSGTATTAFGNGGHLNSQLILINQYGYWIYSVAVENLNVELVPGVTYWLNLWNAQTEFENPAYWDQNSGVGCGGDDGMGGGCPSQAQSNVLGAIPSESFTMRVGTYSTTGVMATPAPGSQLTSSTVTFSWEPGTQSTAYWLDLGSTQYGNNYYQSGNLGTSLHATVSGLPTDGSAAYATLWSLVGGQWVYNEYTYTAYDAASGKGAITSPVPGSQFTGSTVAFTWSAGAGATSYWLDVGSTPGGNQYYQSGNLGNTLTATVNGLPTNGSTVYVTLWSLVQGQWLNNEYSYTAFNASSSLATMQSPTPGSTLSGNIQTFTWNAGNGATAYWLDVGSSLGSNNYYQSGNLGNTLTTTVYSLPGNNSQVYVTLWSLVQGQWYYNEYNYISGP